MSAVRPASIRARASVYTIAAMIAWIITTVSSFFIGFVLLTTGLSYAVGDPVSIAGWLLVPLIVIAGGSVTVLIWLLRRLRRIDSDAAWYADQLARDRCPACAYDLRGREGDRCPECGLDVTPTAR